MRLCRFCLLSLLVLSANSFADTSISGVWKHTLKPAWLEIKFESGVGSLAVQRHDGNPKAAGLNVIKQIKPDINQSSQWNGQMYSAAVDGYVAVRLVLVNSTTIAVYESSDVNESNEILRLAKE